MTGSDTGIGSPLPTASARSLLLTVMGEFAYPRDEAIWTTALVRVLNGLGVEGHAARQAISRSADAGWIERERIGRTARWRLTRSGKNIIEDGLHRATAFLDRSEPWDGRWLVLLVSVPQGERTTRKRLYGGLAWLRMGNPTPGVWLTPHVDTAGDLRDLIAEFNLADTAISFVGHTEQVGLSDEQIVQRAWNLAELADTYQTLLTRFADHRPADGDEFLLNYLELRNYLQQFMRLDPQLPEELLPKWVGHEASELFRDRRERWLAGAWERWEEILDEARPNGAD
ncbi:PaaX family transcriptional regulator [Saccharopolyspora tripterygii]